MGNRGIPANFGGSDTVFEELGERLANRGYPIVVYCRSHFSTTDEKYYKGMERVVLPSFNRFNFDTLTHSFISTLHVLLTNKVDVLNYHGVGNSLVLPLLLFSRKKSVVVLDGPDWNRPKWNWFAKKILKLSLHAALWFADEIITDNVPVHDWLVERFKRTTPLIFYGADFKKVPPGKNLAQWNLKGGDYILFVAMMVSDKGPDLILEAYAKTKTDKKLLMVGDTHYHREFFEDLKQRYAANPNIVFTGFQYGDSYKEYMSNAYIYAHPFRSDGTSPSLLQAMALGNCVLANGVPETIAALYDGGVVFERDSAASMAERLQYLLDNPEIVIRFKALALKVAEEHYNWERIADRYEHLFNEIVTK